ncbi:MAG: N-acetyl-alpha-D-glucosaminyl L-malate synthase BshA [Calditrichaeota bacterium]|nr:N-acetyl-alpha-D-glucosaminyl L-malate synthase BshA [Calditrichota bacterium]
MRIGISCWPTFGGSGVVASELGMGLAERGHEVHFITYAVPGRLNLTQPGIHYHQVSIPDYPLFEYPPHSQALASMMAEVAGESGLQLIHAHYAIPHAASALLAKAITGGRLKVVNTLHGTDITLVGRSPAFMPVVKYAIAHSDGVTAVSEFLRMEVCRTFDCDREIAVIANFVDPRDYEHLSPDPVRRRFAPGGERLLVHVSNFRPVKRIEDVVTVFLKVREQIPVKLILIGNGPELPAAVQRIRESGSVDDLHLLGNIAQVERVVAATDLMLLPSDAESFGLAALEAMACGVPVIGCRAGGLPEVIDDGLTGVLTEVGDTEAMSKAALDLLFNEERRRGMGHQARRAAFERFDRDTILDRYEALYRQVLGI